MVISKKGNFNQSTSSPKEKPQEGEWRSQEIWLCRFRQITLLCMPVPFSFYLTRLCPSPVSSSRQRHFSCPAFSSKKRLGEERTGTESASSLQSHKQNSDHQVLRSLVISKWPGNPLAKRTFFLSLCWSNRERQLAVLLAQAAASCLVKLKARPCWCTVLVSTTTLLLSVCFDKIREIAHKCNVKKPVTIAKLKAC